MKWNSKKECLKNFTKIHKKLAILRACIKNVFMKKQKVNPEFK
jgi:hypothetical protein